MSTQDYSAVEHVLLWKLEFGFETIGWEKAFLGEYKIRPLRRDLLATAAGLNQRLRHIQTVSDNLRLFEK